MNMKGKLKYVVNFILMFIVVGCVLYFALKDNFVQVIDYIKDMNILYLIISIVLICLYCFCIGESMYFITKANNQKYKLKKSVQLNFVVQFFNGITPFSTGGQPSQVYFLHKGNIPIGPATNIVLQNFMVYQIALVLFGVFAVTYNYFFDLFPKDSFVSNLVLVGFIINSLVLVGTFIISFAKRLNNFILTKLIVFLNKIKIIKNREKAGVKFNDYFNKFYENALVLKERKKEVVIAILWNIIALLVLYSIPYVIINGLNIGTHLDYITCLIASAYIMVIGSFVPIPGGSGGLEYAFIHFFGYFLLGAPLVAAMLVWRFITYYFIMSVGGIVLLFMKKE